MQAHVTSDMFRPYFLQKYNLQPLTNNNKPAIFFGVYKKQLPRIMAVSAPVICIWVGTDCLQAVRDPKAFAPLFARSDVRHIAISDVCSRSLALTAVGPNHTVLPITPFDYKEFNIRPLGKQVYYYGLETNRVVYSIDIFNYVKNMLASTGISIYHTQNHDTPRHMMPGIYQDMFCNIRITMHDGLPNTVIEMALMGRHSLWNGSAPGCNHWNCFTDIYNFIIHEAARTQPDKLLRQQMLDFLNIPNDWMKF